MVSNSWDIPDIWQQEKTDITVDIVATNVGASRSPNADRLQRRPLITKPNLMGQPGDAGTCFHKLPNQNPTPASRLKNIEETTEQWKPSIQIAKGK